MLVCSCRLRRAGSQPHRPRARSRPESLARTGCEVHARLHPRNVRRQSSPIEPARCADEYGFGLVHLEVPGATGQRARDRPSRHRPGLPARSAFHECSLRATFANGCVLRLLARGIGGGTSGISRGSRRRHITDRSGGESTRSLDFPARRKIFPVSDHREFDVMTMKLLGNPGPISLSGARNRRNSLYFPSLTGIRPQRRVRPRLSPPPPRLRLQRLSPTIQVPFEKFARFRGVLAIGIVRIRTGDGGFRGESVRLRAFISVANSGGSVWCAGWCEKSACKFASWFRDFPQNQSGGSSLSRSCDLRNAEARSRLRRREVLCVRGSTLNRVSNARNQAPA